MAGYKLTLKTSTANEIDAVGGKEDRRRIVEPTAALATAPRPRGAEKLAGFDDRYRIRHGSDRVVYLIDDTGRVVAIFEVGQRREVYR